MKSRLAEQPNVAPCSRTAPICARASVCNATIHSDTPSPSTFPSSEPPRATALHLTPPCSSLKGQSQKGKAGDGEGRGWDRSAALWGAVTADQSAQLRAFSSGRLCPAGPPQTAPQPPRRPRSLKRAPQDSALWRRPFVLRPQGGRKGVGIDD